MIERGCSCDRRRSAVPQAESIPPPAAYRGLDVTWVGCDGSTWAISDWSSGVALLTEGVSGLHWPAFDFSTLQADSVDGQSQPVDGCCRGRSVRIGVKADSSDAWADLDARWWKSWDPLKTGTLTISSRRGSRSIRLRLEPDEVHQYAIDPNMAALAVYKVQAVADSPAVVQGDPLRRTWSSIDSEPFLDPAGSPPFWITPANLVDTATMANPGDKPAWPVWTVTAAGDVWT